MNLAEAKERIEELEFVIAEMTSPVDELAAELWSAGVRLSPKQQRMLGMLMRKLGKIVTSDALISALYWDDDEPECPIGCIRVFAYQIRQKLAAAGVPITVRSFVGRGNGGYVAERVS